MNDTIQFELDGDEYELKYSFKMIRQMRNKGINIPAIHRAISENTTSASDYADDFVSIAAILLGDAGATVSEEALWQSCNSDRDALLAVMQLFWWIVANHYAQPQGGRKHTVKKM